ncbi:NADP-dependent oxidoreductase [Schleiferilactobacillus shenzhenensis]|nr:NADP-dependent oxidoreductase [Schleiferilactobacillus shenzhenensis]
MKAYGFTRGGGPSALQEFDVPAPQPGPNEVVVTVQAVGLNNRERIAREQGSSRPTIPGRDAAGIVSAVGAGVTTFAVGDRVVAHVQNSYAEQTVARVSSTAKLPDSVDFPTAAALVTSGVTAYRIVHTFGRIQPGEVVIVKGASGGVGGLVVQLAKQAGAYVIGVASARNRILVDDLGVDRFVAYDREKITQVLAETGDVVVNAAMNGAGSDQDVVMAKPTGRIISVSHSEPPLRGQITFQHTYPGDDTDAVALPLIVAGVADDTLIVDIDQVLPFTLAGFIAGHEALDSRHAGRIVVARQA